MIQHKTITFTYRGGCVRISGWFLFGRWALLRYEFVVEPPADADADAH